MADGSCLNWAVLKDVHVFYFLHFRIAPRDRSNYLRIAVGYALTEIGCPPTVELGLTDASRLFLVCSKGPPCVSFDVVAGRCGFELRTKVN